jgi:YD repeat-containing protein
LLPDLTEAQIDGFATDPLGTAPDLLGQATTRIIYDLHRFEKHPPQPVFAATLARETHVSDLPDRTTRSKVQVSMAYSDGAGREVMRKIQAEPGLAPRRDANGVLRCDSNLQPTNPRWVGTGRTVFDNKGNPIKKYEPFFSSTFAYEDEADLVRCGVTPILRYDPLGRLIRADFPNGTFSTVAFDAWQQSTADENDTVRQSRWYIERGSPDPAAPEPTDPEARAAWLAVHHANTPIVAHLDTLGRPFLIIAHNRFERNGTVVEEPYHTHVELDIEGNQRAITDALRRKVMTYAYDMLSTRIHQISIDAGERWMLHDVMGKPIYEWDSRDHQIRHTYDSLHRPTHVFVRMGSGEEKLVERITYGEAHPNAAALNLRGRIFLQVDGAGAITNVAHNPQTDQDEAYDFKGNLLRSTRQLAREYKEQVDWLAAEPALDVAPPALLNLTAIVNALNPLLEHEAFTSSTTYDALNRPVTLTTPDASVIHPTYNEANLLEQVHVNLRGATTATPFVTNLDYNAKG